MAAKHPTLGIDHPTVVPAPAPTPTPTADDAADEFDESDAADE